METSTLQMRCLTWKTVYSKVNLLLLIKKVDSSLTFLTKDLVLELTSYSNTETGLATLYVLRESLTELILQTTNLQMRSTTGNNQETQECFLAQFTQLMTTQ